MLPEAWRRNNKRISRIQYSSNRDIVSTNTATYVSTRWEKVAKMVPLHVKVSPSGMLILGAFLSAIDALFRRSRFCSPLSLWIEEAPTLSAPILWLNAWTCATSLLNVLSHSAVVLAVLSDTYLISILVGVGFDVATRILQLVWFLWWTSAAMGKYGTANNAATPTATAENWATPAFVLFLIIVYIYHMVVHCQALCMNHSLDRLKSVLSSAINNLKGIPGKRYTDHVFAYTDLGTHGLAFWGSAWLLYRSSALGTVAGALAFLTGFAYWLLLTMVPLSNRNPPWIEVVGDAKLAKIACSCVACQRKSERQGLALLPRRQPVSFTVHKDDGICQLWLLSFQELSGMLSVATTRRP